MKYFIYQGNDHDCGFAALKIYLAMIAKDKSYLYIPKPEKREHFTADDLVEIADKYGITLDVCTCTRSYYEHLEEPSIVLIDDNHTVVVKKRTKHWITVYDPGRGKVKMRREEFLRRWRLIVISTDTPETVAKISKLRQNVLRPRLEIISNIVSLVSAGLLIATFYLLNNQDNFWYSLIFLLLFIVCQVLDRIMLYKQVYAFDLDFILSYFDLKENCSREKYIEYGQYKRTFFESNRQIVSSILIAFCITFLLCFNDFRNMFVLFALILIKVLEIFLLSKNEEDNRNEIAEIESKSFATLSSSKDLALQANIKADATIFSNSIKEVFYIFVSFAFAVVMMFVTKNSGCNFVIFHFAMYFTGFNAYNTVITTFSNKKEIQKSERRFFDSCNL